VGSEVAYVLILPFFIRIDVYDLILLTFTNLTGKRRLLEQFLKYLDQGFYQLGGALHGLIPVRFILPSSVRRM